MPSFVTSKLTRCRLLVLLSGVVFGFAVAYLTAMIASMDHGFHLGLRIGVPWAFSAFLGFLLATVLGPYDLLVIVTGFVPAVLYFGVIYATDLFIYIPDHGGFYDIVGGGGPPLYWRHEFYLSEHLWILSYSCAWGLATAFVGILLKRLLLRLKAHGLQAILSPAEKQRVRRALIFDISFLFLITFSVLGFLEVHRSLEPSPGSVLLHLR